MSCGVRAVLTCTSILHSRTSIQQWWFNERRVSNIMQNFPPEINIFKEPDFSIFVLLLDGSQVISQLRFVVGESVNNASLSCLSTIQNDIISSAVNLEVLHTGCNDGEFSKQIRKYQGWLRTKKGGAQNCTYIHRGQTPHTPMGSKHKLPYISQS